MDVQFWFGFTVGIEAFGFLILIVLGIYEGIIALIEKHKKKKGR